MLASIIGNIQHMGQFNNACLSKPYIYLFNIYLKMKLKTSILSKSAHKWSKETLSMLVILNINNKYAFVGTLYGHVHRDIWYCETRYLL